MAFRNQSVSVWLPVAIWTENASLRLNAGPTVQAKISDDHHQRSNITATLCTPINNFHDARVSKVD
jgi:hypothetical protein